MFKNIVVDLNNLIFITRFVCLKTPKRNDRKEAYAKELIFKDTLKFIVRFAAEQKANAIVIACDSKHVWRKDIFPEYKGSEKEEDVYYVDCIAAADMIKEFFRQCTNSYVLEVPRTEADDVIAIWCNESENVENVIVSSDRDFMQLISDTTSLYSPSQKVFRESLDPEYDLFLKCIRGDKNDNIASAFPRVRATKLMEAWENPEVMQDVLETYRKDGVKVADAIEFNLSLIDLTLQPENIKQDIRDQINTPQVKSFGEFKIMKYLAEHNLKEYADMLTYKERPLRGIPKFKDG